MNKFFLTDITFDNQRKTLKSPSRASQGDFMSSGLKVRIRGVVAPDSELYLNFQRQSDFVSFSHKAEERTEKDIEDSVFRIYYPTELLRDSGKVLCQLELRSDGKITESAHFEVEVSRSIRGSLKTENARGQLEDMVEQGRLILSSLNNLPEDIGSIKAKLESFKIERSTEENLKDTAIVPSVPLMQEEIKKEILSSVSGIESGDITDTISSVANSVIESKLSELNERFAQLTHTHTISDIVDLGDFNLEELELLLTNKIAELSDKVDSDSTNQNQQIDDLKNKIGKWDAESGQTISESINDIKNEIENFNDINIVEINQKIEEIKLIAEELSARDFESIVSRVDDLEEALNSPVGQHNLNIFDEIKRINTDLESVKGFIDPSLVDRVSLLEERIKSLNTYDDTTLVERLEELESRVVDVESGGVDLSGIQEEINNIKSEIEKISTGSGDVDLTEVTQRISSLEEIISSVATYDDTEIKEKLSELENRVDKDTVYDDTDIRQRISELESKSDNDTVYDDTDIKQRLLELESKSDNDTIYDDTDIKQRISELESKVDNDTIYDDAEIREQIERIKLEVNGLTNYDDTELSKRLDALENKVDNDTVYDDTELKNRVKFLEEKPDKDTIYDDSEIRGMISDLEDALNSGISDDYLREELADIKAKIQNLTESSSTYDDRELRNIIADLEAKIINVKSYSVATTSIDGLMSSSDKSKLDGIDSNANNYTHPSSHPISMIQGLQTELNKKADSSSLGDISSINKSGSSMTYLRGDGVWETPPDTDTVYNTMGVEEGISGTSKEPRTVRADYLSEIIYTHIQKSVSGIGDDASTVNGYTVEANVPSDAKFTDTTYAPATTSTNGLMSSEDKSKLGGIENGANRYEHPSTHPISMISGLQSALDGMQKKLPSGTNGQFLKFDSNGNIVAGADNNTTYSNATTSVSGLLSSSDKSKLDGISAGANNYTHPSTHPISMITGLQTELNSKVDKSAVGDISSINKSGSTTTFLRGDGTWAAPLDSDTTYTTMSVDEGKAGTATNPRTIRADYLRQIIQSHAPTSLPANGGDASTVDGFTVKSNVPANAKFTDTTYAIATTSANGLMSAADKTKINGIEANANNYTHPASHPISMITGLQTALDGKAETTTLGDISGINKSGTTTTYLRGDGTWATPPNTNTTYEAMSVAEGTAGTGTASRSMRADYLKQIIQSYIPSSLPANGGNADTVGGFTVGASVPSNAKFTDTTYGVATTSANGLLSSTDKAKLDGIAAGATKYTHPSTHPYSMITGAPTSLPANGGNADTVGGFTVGTNVPANAKFTDTNTTYSAATTSVAGLMSAADKVKLNGIATGANKYVHPSTHSISEISGLADELYFIKTVIANSEIMVANAIATKQAKVKVVTAAPTNASLYDEGDVILVI